MREVQVVHAPEMNPTSSTSLPREVGRYGENYTSSLSLRVGRSGTSPNRMITNGSIISGNLNRSYHEVNGNLNGNGISPNGVISPSELRFEVPLPFGYHMDLDFLRVCSDDINDESLQKLKGRHFFYFQWFITLGVKSFFKHLDFLFMKYGVVQELRKTRRKQRKTLEVLMGLRTGVQETKMAVLTHAPRVQSRPQELNLASSCTPDIVNSSELVRDALRESMVSFQVDWKLNVCK